MPAVASDPNTFTKERLKKELLKHDVTLPPSDAKKQTYVDLYHKHIQHVQQPSANLNFSSDEEATPARKAKPGSPRKSIRKLDRMPASKEIAPDILQLTDAELHAQLTDRGVDVGPITDTTRKVYQRKLQTLLAGQPHLDVSGAEDPAEEEFSDEDKEEVEQPVQSSRPERKPMQAAPVLQSSFGGRRSYRTADRKDHSDTSESGMTSIRQRLTQQEERVQHSSSRPEIKAEKPKQAPTKRRLSVFAQIAIFLIIAIIVFLVIQNLDPNIKKPWLADKS